MRALKNLSDMYDTARQKIINETHDYVEFLEPGRPKVSNEDGTIPDTWLLGDEDRNRCELKFRIELVKKPNAPSDEEIDKRVEGLVELYKRNAEAFIRDFNRTHIERRLYSRPFTEQELVTIHILRVATTQADDADPFTVNSLHKVLTAVIENYKHPRARTYRGIERGVKVGLFEKSKVKGKVSYTLTQSAKELRLQLLRKTIADYINAARSLQLGTTKAPELSQDMIVEMQVKSVIKTVNFYLLGHY